MKSVNEKIKDDVNFSLHFDIKGEEGLVKKLTQLVEAEEDLRYLRHLIKANNIELKQ